MFLDPLESFCSILKKSYPVIFLKNVFEWKKCQKWPFDRPMLAGSAFLRVSLFWANVRKTGTRLLKKNWVSNGLPEKSFHTKNCFFYPFDPYIMGNKNF
jgi:hypothetical protein